jgi:hypothetical protein
VYKIISKILADRIGRVLDGIISPMQNAFLRGHRMADNINILQELLKHYERKRTSLDALLKLILEKPLTSFNGLSCGICFSFLASLINLFTLL